MRPVHPTSGFTLVELALVVAVVGLLLAGVLGLGRMRTHAALVATAADVQAIGTATAVFLDRYGDLPGDLVEAAARIPGCRSGECEADSAAVTTGDGHVGSIGGILNHQTAGATPAERETLLFWTHLLLSDLLTGTRNGGAGPASELAWGVSHPGAPVGGGFHVKDADGGGTTTLPGWPPSAQQPSGTFLVLQAQVARNLAPAQGGGQVLTATQAAWMDRKLDDGDPFTGDVVGYGTVTMPMAGAGCFSWTAVNRGRYDESRAAKDCGLAFRITP